MYIVGDYSSIHRKYPVRYFVVLENPFYAFALCVADENLAKTVIAHHFNNLVHPFIVQFVKNIIQQNNRFEIFNDPGVLVLCQLNGNNKGFFAGPGSRIF